MKFIISILLIVSQVGEGSRWHALDAQMLDVWSSDSSNSTLLPAAALAKEGKTFTRRNFSEERDNSILEVHDYHISNFDIEWNAETNALEIIAKIFIDDLEDGIAASGVTEKLYLCTDREIEAGDDHVYRYLTNKMNINVNGEDVDFNYIGKEVSEDLVAMYCYLEVENIDSVQEISITNDMLMELFDDQINIIKLISKSTKQRGFMMLKKGAHSDTVNWQ